MKNQVEKNMEHQMETGVIGLIGAISGLYWGCYWDNGSKMETTIWGVGD